MYRAPRNRVTRKETAVSEKPKPQPKPEPTERESARAALQASMDRRY